MLRTKKMDVAKGSGPRGGMVYPKPDGESDLRAVKDRIKKQLKIPGFKRCPKTPKPSTSNAVENPPPKEVVLSFMDHLSQKALAEASKHLISLEEQLFTQKSAQTEGGSPTRSGEEEDKLHADYQTLLVQLWMAVHDSFSPAPSREHLEVLRGAVIAVMQQEEQDRQWEDRPDGLSPPEWRPLRCRSTHNSLLQMMVESRLRNATVQQDIEGADNLSTDMKREVCKVGKCLKKDLLVVVRDVKDCYPQDLDICNLYARMYHRTFSTQLTELARSGLDVDDCTYLLFWINDYYPNTILQDKELKMNINSESMGSLVPEEDQAVLEEQYLAHKEDKVITWFNEALKNEVKDWQKGNMPEIIDGYCFCPLAIDIIQVINCAVKECKSILGNKSKGQRILSKLESFLISYKHSLDEFMKGRRDNTQAILKANLVSIKQIRDFIIGEDDSMSEEIKAKCLLTLTSLKDCGYGYFIGPMQEELKVQYKRLWTHDWLTGSQNILENILETLYKNLENFTDLKPVCREELLGRLHTDVMVEYVKRMMKRKIKLRNSEQQENAARLLSEDNRKLNSFFIEEWGSKESWLSEILPKLAEVLRLQDPGSIQLEIVTLAVDHPDLRTSHVSALLSLKTNLSAADTRTIKESLEENRLSLTTANDMPPFFSKVPVKWIIKIM
ncbi:tumor necrosis factor alpha-induced protein 2a [Osmerus mordax]|uniref:tumor necrosis factor alpha-induced protein 2a n=1 Tax=Osmerus mordax TaxID=8014 RepID=UPI00351076F5